MQFHDTLNEKIWDLEKEDLKPEVKDKLNEIADAFIEYLDIPADAIEDVVITGSCASYNYTEFSDIDLHLLVDFEKVHTDCPVVEGYLLSRKSEFNKNHDIFIYGIPVEVYAESINNENVHNGLYSLRQEKWIDIPKKLEPTDNDSAVQAKYLEYKQEAELCDDSEVATELINKIREMRKSGLAEGGEFSTENLTFKKLRDNGIIGKLMEIKKKGIDKQLSLESYNEAEDIISKINKLIDNVNKTILDTIKNKKEAKLYTLKQNKNKDGQTVLKLYRGGEEFMTSKLVKDSLLGDDIIGHLNSIKSSKYESIKEEIDKQLSLESYDDKYKHLDRFLNTLPKNRTKYIGVELKDKDGNFEKGLITISYEEPKRDNPIIFYNFHIDCVKNDICQDKAYASLIIDTIKDSIEEYANRHGLEIIKTTSYSSTNESIKEGFFKKELSPLPKKDAKYKIGDKVKVGKDFGEVIAVKRMKMSDTSTYQIKLENGKTVWRYEEELNESVDLQKIFANHPYWTTGEAEEISKDLDELPKGTKIEHRVDNSWHECVEYYVKTDINKTFNDTKANWSYIYIVDGEEVRRKPMTSFDVALDIKEYNNSADGFIVNEPQNKDFEENMDMKEEFIIRKQSEFDGATEEEVGQADSELNAEEAGKEELKQMIADKKIAHPLIKIYKRDAETGNDTFVKDIKPIDLEENQVEESVDHLTDKIDYVNSQLRELIQSIARPIEEPVLAESHELSVKLLAQIDEALGE